MINNKKVIAIIPARGGSKTIPQKNIKTICNRPLIAWSILAAKGSKYIDKIIVSTDDKEIADISKNWGAEVLDRPKKYATDTATTISVLQHAIKEIPGHDIIVLLQPTSPLRANGMIDAAIEKFIKSKADTLATGYICKDYEWGTTNNIPRQKLKGWFYDDGNIYIHKPDHLIKGKWTGKKMEKMLIDKVYNFEIDDQVDFYIIEKLMEKYGQK
jgi:CMP-N-acetylneuraminic acid synthetase